MKKIILLLTVAAFTLQLSTACTDYLESGSIDLTIPEEPEVPFEYPTEYNFNNPCALIAQADIDRVKAAITAADANDPVYASWLFFCKSQFAQETYQPNPQKIVVRGDATGTGVDPNTDTAGPCMRDAAAAMQLALRYRISGDEKYASTAINILNAWARTCIKITANDANYLLLAGFQGYTFANAANMLIDWTGWADTDKTAFKNWMMTVWYPHNRDFVLKPGNSNTCALHYWPNWQLCNMSSMLAIGHLMKDPAIITMVYKNFREGEGSGALHHMIPYAPVEDPDGKTTGMLAQNMESGRDQGHATLVISMCAEMCQMAWNMGIDFFGMDNNKVLAMCEYTAKWNARPDGRFLTTTMPFTEYKYCIDCACRDKNHGATHTVVTNDDGRGKERPGWDLVYNHYAKVKGLGDNACYYSKLFAEQLRYTNGTLTGDGGAGDSRYGGNSSAFDQFGWSTMLFAR